MHFAVLNASKVGKLEVIKLLIKFGAPVNKHMNSEQSPLTFAAIGNRISIALFLINHGANIEEVNNNGYTPLMEACRFGHKFMVEVLLRKGKHITTICNC